MALFEKILAEAALQRQRSVRGKRLIGRADTVSEVTPMGRMHWYLHPDLFDATTRSLYMHELEIEPGGHSGRLQVQGGQMHYVLDGAGYTNVDGIRHRWVDGDVIAIPIREEGVWYQHVNDGTEVVRMLVVWPNLDSALGPEAGVEMRLYEKASCYSGSDSAGSDDEA